VRLLWKKAGKETSGKRDRPPVGRNGKTLREKFCLIKKGDVKKGGTLPKGWPHIYEKNGGKEVVFPEKGAAKVY